MEDAHVEASNGDSQSLNSNAMIAIVGIFKTKDFIDEERIPKYSFLVLMKTFGFFLNEGLFVHLIGTSKLNCCFQ